MVKLAALVVTTSVMVCAAELNLMPLPAKYSLGTGRLAIDQNFHTSAAGNCGPILTRALERFAQRLSSKTGVPRAVEPPSSVALEVQCEHPSKAVQALGEDESYTLEVDSKQARLKAPNTLGALRGLETFLQLVQQDDQGFGVPAISIEDQPRFPWRGLMLDVSRHWMPIEVVKRTLEGMAVVKMNVFHWHLADDQGFRVESKRLPKLQGKGSDGHYFTQAQVREVVEYARDRGIRVVPEFDIPGHATSWLVGYPELGTKPGPYEIERHWGVFDPTLDPSKEAVYQFLDKLIGEMAPLFDDEFFHIGGDEVNGKHWTESEQVQAFMKKEGLKDLHQFHRYFNRRIQAIVKKHGKRMEGWDEILEPDLPKSIVIQSWQGQKSLNEAVQQGYSGLLSGGYYLDLMHSTERHYLVDPIDEAGASLTDEQRKRILGGEACMWVELATPENIDGRIWPRAAAIAERLWSPQSVRDVHSMYTRLEAISRHLEATAGLTHRRNYQSMLERLAGVDPMEPVQVLAEIVEPVKDYTRSTAHPEYTQFTPLNRLVDTVRPESEGGRNLRYAVAAKDWETVRKMLTVWRENDAKLKPIIERHELLKETGPLSASLAQVAAVGLNALDRIEGRASSRPVLDASQVLRDAEKPFGDLLLMAVPGVNALVTMAAGSPR